MIGQILFLINIQFPKGQNFDEFHYVPSAKQFLDLKENQNWEHPPLGKELMAIGIGTFGDSPIGWRFMSTVFGSLTLVGMFLWALALFRNEKTALWVAAISVVNNLLYVQARIGMLDTFMFAFMVWGLAAFTATWNPELSRPQVRRYWGVVGMMLGLATACKWFGVIPWFTCLALICVVRILQSWKTSFAHPTTGDWYHPQLWKGLTLRDVLQLLVLYPLLIYYATFIPLLFTKGNYHFFDIFFEMQRKMWDGQLRVVTNHPYMSNFMDWPILKRPIWYAFDKEGNDFVRGVLLLGNPLIMWGGLLALLGCLWGWIKTRSSESFLILAFYAAFYLSWAIIPRKVSFYYYYYPAGMVLGLALAYCFSALERAKAAAAQTIETLQYTFLGLSLALFVYFFPILAALRIPADSFRKWMWFSSWI
ncbi:MAG: phospholipid carrier-dependent glycosyltransferase [Bdellovibrionota bacterium]